VDWAMESHNIAKNDAYKFPDDRKLGEDCYQANVTVERGARARLTQRSEVRILSPQPTSRTHFQLVYPPCSATPWIRRHWSLRSPL
jgi:hypothetical protein